MNAIWTALGSIVVIVMVIVIFEAWYIRRPAKKPTPSPEKEPFKERLKWEVHYAIMDNGLTVLMAKPDGDEIPIMSTETLAKRNIPNDEIGEQEFIRKLSDYFGKRVCIRDGWYVYVAVIETPTDYVVTALLYENYPPK